MRPTQQMCRYCGLYCGHKVGCTRPRGSGGVIQGGKPLIGHVPAYFNENHFLVIDLTNPKRARRELSALTKGVIR